MDRAYGIDTMSISDTSNEIREGLHALARGHRILDLEGHNDMSLGHLSMRDPKGRGIWMKRALIGLDEVLDEDFLLLDFEGNVLDGEGVRHLEWPMHTELIAARADIDFVGHTHPPYATYFTATQEVLQPYTNEGVWFESNVPHYKKTSDLIDSIELGRALSETLGEARAVFLKNHGVTFVGGDIKEVVLGGIFLERAARAQITLAQVRVAHAFPDRAEIAAKRNNIFTDKAVNNFWQYYNRKLDRMEGGRR